MRKSYFSVILRTLTLSEAKGKCPQNDGEF
jgi:hypothetical protein